MTSAGCGTIHNTPLTWSNEQYLPSPQSTSLAQTSSAEKELRIIWSNPMILHWQLVRLVAMRTMIAFRSYPLVAPFMSLGFLVSSFCLAYDLKTGSIFFNPAYCIWGIVAFGGMCFVVYQAAMDMHGRKK